MLVVPLSSSAVIFHSSTAQFGLEAMGYKMHGYDADGDINLDDVPTDIDELHEAAGRGCYQSWVRPNPATATNEGYLSHILDIGHESILEHGSVSFFVSGVSRAMLLELERHRHLSFSVISQRYVDSSETEVVIPPVIRDCGDPALVEAIKDHMKKSQLLYGDLVNALQYLGNDRKTARGAARCVLPEGTETKMVVSGNIRAWRYVIKMRNSSHADQEIREFAQEILRHLKVVAPNSVQDLEI